MSTLNKTNNKNILCKSKQHNKKPAIIGPSRYVFYSIVNTNFRMDQGTRAAVIAHTLMMLHSKLDHSETTSHYIDMWVKTGLNKTYREKIVILKGYDHKHLRYLQKEAKYLAIAMETNLQSQGRHSQVILVLSVFGQEEDLEELFEDLSYLR